MANASEAAKLPSLQVALAVAVTLAEAVQADSHVVMFVVTAEANVIVELPLVHVPLTPNDVGSGDFMMRITSPGAIRAAVAPDVMSLNRKANEVPLLELLPAT